MSSVDLENLDNKTLRAKCVEYGLPNVPITDTSKKLLIRRLRAAMDGNPTKNKPKPTRRETIQVTETIHLPPKISTPKKETPKKLTTTNNRRTIGATVQDDVQILPALIAEKRRPSRGTPIIQEHIIPVQLQRKPVSQPIFEENDFNDDFILIDDDTPDTHPLQSQMATSYRKSRSPSLGKSAIITTSYKKETTQLQKSIPEDESESDEPPSPIAGRSKIQNYDISNAFIPNRSVVEPISVPRYSQPSTYLNRSNDREEFPTGYKSIYPTLNSIAVPETSKYSYDNTSTTRRYTTSGGLTQQPIKLAHYNTSATKRISAQQHYAENSDSNDDNSGGDAELEEDAPYLSDFARRLSRLKAEPLDIGYKQDLSELRDHRYGSSVIGNRRSNYSARRNSTVADSFKEFWFALDYKYKIMRKLIILCFLSMIVLSIYIYINYNN